jgi:hypothetical protein
MAPGDQSSFRRLTGSGAGNVRRLTQARIVPGVTLNIAATSRRGIGFDSVVVVISDGLL